MRVHIAENTVVLTPYQKHLLPQIPHNDVFTQIGLPQSDLTATLIAFSVRMNSRCKPVRF